MNDNIDMNFKDYPQTIGEIRSDKTDRASDWAPRDALIDLLRRIDNGTDVRELVISFAILEDGDLATNYLVTQKRNASLGLMARVMHLINEA